MNEQLDWEDKIDSPELTAWFQQFGLKYYLNAEQINQIRDRINFLLLTGGGSGTPAFMLVDVLPTTGIINTFYIIDPHNKIFYHNGSVFKNIFDAINLSNYYTKTEVDSLVSSVYKAKGSVADFASLPSSGQITGDVWNVISPDGMNYLWTGSAWDELGGLVDISGKEDVSNKSNDIADKTSTTKFWSAKFVYDWAISLFQPKPLVEILTPSANVTGTIAETVLYTWFVPANKYSATDVFFIKDFTCASNGAMRGTSLVRVKFNTVNALPTTLDKTYALAFLQPGSVDRYCSLDRKVRFSGGKIKGYNNNAGAFTDKASNNYTINDFNPAVDNWFFFTIKNENTSDSTYMETLIIGR